MNLAVLWLVIMIACLIIEIATLGLTTIWFAGGALAATVTALIGLPLYVQAIVFILVSVVLIYFTRPIAVKHFNKDRIKTNAESLVGLQAIVISEIDNLQGTGQVTINGLEWSARSVSDLEKFPVGTVVHIVAIQGVKLIVEEKREEKS